MNVAGQHIVVIGLGKSGRAAARLLVSRGARVTATDLRSEGQLEEAAALRLAGVELVLGRHPESLLVGADRIVVSPGVPPLRELALAEKAGVKIASEVEAASWFIEARIIGITGTNGKSTVTSMVGDMCTRSGRPTFVGGNLGVPLIDAVGSTAGGQDGLVVAELSSFQLERVDRLRLSVAALLNLTHDHLDRYADLEAYAAAKQNIFRCQRAGDAVVVPATDARCQALASVSEGRVFRFGHHDGADVAVRNGHICDASNGLSFPVSALRLAGRHNLDNACAAGLIARLAGIDREHIEGTLGDFSGLPHRMQHVASLADVTYYDDSKATNVGAAVASLAGMSSLAGRVVLIAGGKHKGGSYRPLVEALEPRARAAVLIGEAAPLIGKALDRATFPVVRAGSMRDAVNQAARVARAGDVVLLAPACSSFDMFRSYAERGELFQQAVLARKQATQWN